MSQDTSLHAQAQFETLLRERSGSDRVVMACEMFDCGRALVEARLRAELPDISPGDLRVGLLYRL
jgi:hypothetical protein